jgi:hypothetical protein
VGCILFYKPGQLISRLFLNGLGITISVLVGMNSINIGSGCSHRLRKRPNGYQAGENRKPWPLFDDSVLCLPINDALCPAKKEKFFPF